MPNHISDRRFQSLKTGIIPEIKSIFPVQVENKKLELRDLEITDKKDILNYPDQRKAILENKTWGEDIIGTFELSENEKLIGKKKIKIGELPKLTTRGTFLIDGTEYHIFNQLRLRPGVYTVQKDNKEIETKFNFLPKDKISGFNITFKKGKFNIAIHNRQIPLYSILKAFDIPDKNIENVWGKEIFEQNKLSSGKNEENISKLYSSIFYKDPDNYEQAVSELKTKFENTQLTPEILQDTLNLNTDHLSSEVFLKASQKLLNVIKGKEKPDERDNLRNKQIYTPQDLLIDRIHRLSPKIQKDISRKLRRETDIRRVVDSYVINKPIKTFFTQTDLSSVSEGTNPINLAESFEKITTLGEGGIKDILAAPESSREVHPSHFGIIDPLHTAESQKVGLTTHLALGTDIQNKDPIKVVNNKDGKTRVLPYKEFFNNRIGIDRTLVKGKINALFKGEKIKVSPEKVDYYIDNPAHFFDISTNLIPFLNYNQGNRAITGAKMMGQALSLKDREEPLTQEFYAKDKGSMEELMMELPESPIGGTIEKIDKESITIKGDDKKSYTINLYNNFPIESNAYLQNIPTVKKGDFVKKGQILAENNFSKNGKLALGKHLRTAIMPWKGYSHQDGIVISESAAQKLTSNHIYRINIPIEENSTFNLKKFRAYYPDKITKSLAEKLTEDGVIKVGQKVDAGDIIAAKLNKVEILPDEIKLGKLSKSLVKPYRDQSSVWDKTVSGIVTDIVKTGKQIQVYIKTEEPTVVGDKLSARSANKGIVSIIVPDDEMPKTKDGEHMEILINPLSIPSRVILGQLLEIGSNKLAKKKGHPLLIKNFEKGYTKTLLNELKKEGLEDKEILYNPKTNKPYKNPILTGPQYFLKLKHQAATQFSSRDYGSMYDLNMQPLSGREGGCFPYRSFVDTEKGSIDIRDIVIKKMNVRVYSYNFLTNKIELKKITKYFQRRRNKDEKLMRIKSARIIRPTENHEIYTDWNIKEQVKNIKNVYMKDIRLNSIQIELLYGTLLGDSNLNSKCNYTARWQLSHCNKQKEYFDFKKKLLNGISGHAWHQEKSNMWKLTGKTTYQLKQIYDDFYKTGVKKVPLNIEKYLTPWSIALWYMDDGCFSKNIENSNSVECHLCSLSFSLKDIKRLVKIFENKFNIYPRIRYRKSVHGYEIVFSRKETLKFLLLIAPYVIDSMKYKVGLTQRFKWNKCVYCGKEIALKKQICNQCLYTLVRKTKKVCKYYGSAKERFGSIKNVREGSILIEKEIPEIWENVKNIFATKTTNVLTKSIASEGITQIEIKGISEYKDPGRKLVYNLEIEDNHNYFVNRILVGNSKAMDSLTLYGMLAHGSNANIKEMVQFKSTKNPDYWRAIQTGAPLPTPKPTFAFQKFINHLNGLGINVKQNDNQFMLLPLTDKDIIERSSGELKHPEKILKGHKMDPEDQGLFDTFTTGGLKGTKMSHFKLSEPMPNPIFENGIKALTGIKGENYKKLVTGKLYIEKDGTLTAEKTDLTGGKALQYLLSKIDVAKELETAQRQITTAKGSTLDGLNKKIKYLETLKVHKLDPTVYILNNIPVMPPTFRQIYPLPKGNIFISDINKAYKNLALANNKLKELKQELPDEDLIPLREKLYQGVNALMGVTGAKPLGFESYKGILDILAGPTPKRGMYQGTQIRRTLEGTGRATITSDPYLGVDEIGLPEQMSWTLFTPFVVRRLHKSGYSINEAHKLIKEQKDVARKALVQEMNEHPVLLNRAPSLHKFNIMAFQPKLVSGKQIAMTHLPMTGFNADVDGDSLTVHVPISKSAIKEAYKMFPSQHLKKPGTGELMLYPQHESLMGLYYLTKPGETIQKKYKEQKDILQDLSKKTIELDTTISLQGKKITAGTVLVNSILPPNIQIEKPIDKKEMLRVLNLLSKDSKQYAGTVDKLKNLGYEYITERGYSFGLKDIAIGFPEKKEILSTFKPGKSEEINKKLDKLISTKFTKEQNPIFDAVVSGARAKPSDIRKMLISPVTALDSYGNVTEEPIKSSYSEGLSLNEYLNTSFGVRRGVIGKSKEVTHPGWFNKKLLASTADVIITDKEIADPGIDMVIDHQDILDRFTAKTITLKDSKVPINTLITEDLINKLDKEKIYTIKVRSPLSVTHNQLIPQKSFGLLENGELPKPGTNIGIIASQSLAEPLTQSALSLFHSPGVAQGAPTGGYFEISRLLDMPKTIADKAELSPVGGRVEKIKKTDIGFNIQIGDKFEKLITGQKINVREGQTILKGRPLTEGKTDPKELIMYTGIENTQKFLTDNLERVYHDAGIPIKRRYLETIIQKITDNARIIDPGESDFLPGDIVPATKLKQVEMETGAPIKYEPYLRGINLAPLMTHDWLARLNFGHLKKTVSEGALRGWSSNIKSSHPMPGIVYGADLEAEPYEVD